MPETLDGDGKLVYVSLGSLGAAKPKLMGRLVDLLGRTSYRVIMSMGPQAGQIALPDNIHGEELLPQPSILPLRAASGGNASLPDRHDQSIMGHGRRTGDEQHGPVVRRRNLG